MTVRKHLKKCEICGKPCRIRYCEACAKKQYKENAKAKRMANKSQTWQGCDEDCFNCKYPDCRKPARDMKPIRELTTICRCDKNLTCESQSRMFTVELGGFGGARPNISRKFYF